jgi:transmembrane sensor
MNLSPSRRLTTYAEPRVDDERVDRVWAAVSRRPMRAWTPPSFRRAAAMTAIAGLATSAAAAMALFLALRARTPAPASVGLVLESGGSNTATLADGTRTTLGAGARLRWDRIQPDRVEATLERGHVAFDVRHDASRAFLVHAAGLELRDLGTRFVVDVEANLVSVIVEDGRIEIGRSGSRPLILTAGETWTSGPAGLEESVAPTVPSPITASLATASRVPSEPNGKAQAPPNPAEGIVQTAKNAAPEPRGTTPLDLLQMANEARLAGRPKRAADAFDSLRRRFRTDPRAALAAFELGRLRLDSLGDPAGAAEALADAIALAPAAPFREDADARLVEAFERMPDARACAAARRTYLSRYPNGVHAADVAARCP